MNLTVIRDRAVNRMLTKGEKMRERLLQSAAALFQEFGYVRVSIRDVVAAVHAPKGSFYNYFGSKEVLASEFVERQFVVIFKTLKVSPDQSPAFTLRLHFETIALQSPDVSISALRLLSTFAAEAPALPPVLLRQLVNGIGIWTGRVRRLISLAQRQSESPPTADPQQLAIVLINCWLRAVLRTKVDPTGFSFEDFARFVLDSFITRS